MLTVRASANECKRLVRTEELPLVREQDKSGSWLPIELPKSEKGLQALRDELIRKRWRGTWPPRAVRRQPMSGAGVEKIVNHAGPWACLYDVRRCDADRAKGYELKCCCLVHATGS